MKKQIILVLLAFVGVNCLGQNLQWAKSTSFGSVQGYSIDNDQAGNVYITGTYNSASNGGVDFDMGINTFFLKSNTNTVFVCKYNHLGEFVWAKDFIGDVSTGGRSISVDKEGNIFVSGTFTGNIDVDPGANIYNLTAAQNGAFLVKLDANGNFNWAMNLPETDNEGISITIDLLGNVYCKNSYEEPFDFNPNEGVYILTPTRSVDVFILKLDNDGHFVWAKNLSVSNSRYTDKAIDVDYDGNVYITGNFGLQQDFDPGDSIFTLTASGLADAFILKLDYNGGFLWAKNIGGTDVVRGNSITTDIRKNVYLTGQFKGTVDFDPNEDTLLIVGKDNPELDYYDAFLLKLDSLGNMVFANAMGDHFPDAGYTVNTDSLMNIYTTGTFTRKIDFDPSEGVYELEGSGQKSSFFQKLDSSGHFIYARSISGSEFNFSYSTTVDFNGNSFTAGRYKGACDFDPDEAEFTLSGTGENLFIVKLSPIPSGPSEISGETRVYSGDTSIYSINEVSGAENYVWIIPNDASIISGQGSSTVAINFGSLSGNISVTPNNSYGNSTTRSLNITVLEREPVLSIADQRKRLFNFYPNPSQNIITIQTSSENLNQSYTITDEVGRSIINGKLTSLNTEVDTSRFPMGIYFIHLGDLNRESFKLVKQ